MLYFPGNTLTNYTTKLLKTIELNGEWEVGLAEIQYPVTWYTLEDSQEATTIGVITQTNSDQPVVETGYITAGHYDDVPALIIEINRVLRKIMGDSKIFFKYNSINGKVSIKIPDTPNTTITVMLTPALYVFLGYKDTQVRKDTKTAFVSDINQGFYSLFVYTDILEHRPVGDITAPLLRVIPVTGYQGDVITKIYENIQYFPIQKKQFDTIEIDIRTDMGKPVKFKNGKVLVTLHFRKRRMVYL